MWGGGGAPFSPEEGSHGPPREAHGGGGDSKIYLYEYMGGGGAGSFYANDILLCKFKWSLPHLTARKALSYHTSGQWIYAG